MPQAYQERGRRSRQLENVLIDNFVCLRLSRSVYILCSAGSGGPPGGVGGGAHGHSNSNVRLPCTFPPRQALVGHLAAWGVAPVAIVVDPLLPPHAEHFAATLWQVHLLHPATGATQLLAVGAHPPQIRSHQLDFFYRNTLSMIQNKWFLYYVYLYVFVTFPMKLPDYKMAPLLPSTRFACTTPRGSPPAKLLIRRLHADAANGWEPNV